MIRGQTFLYRAIFTLNLMTFLTILDQSQVMMGTSEPEKFYEINGQRVYSVEIDGKPVEEHFETEGQ